MLEKIFEARAKKRKSATPRTSATKGFLVREFPWVKAAKFCT